MNGQNEEKIYHITGVEVQNIKKLKYINLKLKNGIVVIEGDNRQGKTSLLDSIAYVLGGKELIPDNPIREGQTEGFAKIELDDIVVERKWKSPIESAITIKNIDGKPIRTAPQKFLDDKLGAISLEVMEFVNMDKDERVKFFQRITKFDLADLKKQYEEAYLDRRDLNRDVDTMEKELVTFKNLPELVQTRTMAEIQGEMNVAIEENKKIDIAEMNVRSIRELIKMKNQAIGDHEKSIDELMKNIEKAKQKIESITKEMEENLKITDKQKTDLAKYQEEIKTTTVMENLKGMYKSKETLELKLTGKKSEVQSKESKMKELEAEKQKRIDGLKLPIEGLVFDGKEIKYNNVEISQCSEEEQISIGIAMAIQENPKIRILLVRRGSGLGSKAMQRISEMAEKSNFQVIMERQADQKGDAIFLEDGEVK